MTNKNTGNITTKSDKIPRATQGDRRDPIERATTPGKIAKFAAGGTLTDSIITEDTGRLGVGTAPATAILTVTSATNERPAIDAHNTATALGGVGVHGVSPSGIAVRGDSQSGTGVSGRSFDGPGVVGKSTSDTGVLGTSDTGAGVRGSSNTGVNGAGVHGSSPTSVGVLGESTNNLGVIGLSTNFPGVFGSSPTNNGVVGQSTSRNGVVGGSTNGNGVVGASGNGVTDTTGNGVFGTSTNGAGVRGLSTVTDGVQGHSFNDFSAGVSGGNSGAGFGIYGENLASGLAGQFVGNVDVSGRLRKGSGGFLIDHPLDPANKTLTHSFVESPDMMNIYNGNTITDAQGNATITLPAYFQALNREFRYQLTMIEQFAQAIVSSEIQENHFTIKTDKPHVKVSWMVTGVRQDAYANAHRLSVEDDKPAKEQGTYLHPEAHGQPKSKGVNQPRLIGEMLPTPGAGETLPMNADAARQRFSTQS